MDDDQYGAAQPHVGAALEGLRVLVATDPTNMGWQRDLASAELQAAKIAASQGTIEAALGALDAALTRVEWLLAADSRDVFSVRLRASLLLEKGDVLQQFGRESEAQDPWSLAIGQIDTAFDDVDDPTLLATLSGLLHRNEDHVTEGELQARLVANGYAGPDVAGLVNAHAIPNP